MRTLCDHCERAAANLFCSADEAALCHACDEKVHMCNKLASRHVRVGLAKPNDFPRCDICENEPAFFYCEVDGSSLCLQCDVSVHVGVKGRHVRYLLHRQRVEFPGDITLPEANSQPVDKINSGLNQTPKQVIMEDNQQQNHRLFSLPMPDSDAHGKMDNNMIDLNSKPLRLLENPPNDN